MVAVEVMRSQKSKNNILIWIKLLPIQWQWSNWGVWWHIQQQLTETHLLFWVRFLLSTSTRSDIIFKQGVTEPITTLQAGLRMEMTSYAIERINSKRKMWCGWQQRRCTVCLKFTSKHNNFYPRCLRDAAMTCFSSNVAAGDDPLPI